MYLSDSLSRQPFRDDCWFFLTKLSQFPNGFLTFPKMIRLVVNILELIHFGSTLVNKWESSRRSLGIFFLKVFFISFISFGRFFFLSSGFQFHFGPNIGQLINYLEV